MPLQQLQFRPGVNREGTTLANEGGWYESQWVRFKSGYPQKIGGWVLLSKNIFIGTCRSLWNWVTLKGFNLVSVGTESKFYIEYGGEYFDVTPIRDTVTLTNPFTTNINTGTERIVTVTDAGHGADTGDYVTFSDSTAVGGISADALNREFVITYVDANTYTITTSESATSVATGGGTVIAEYQINAGKSVATLQVGWGTGLWGGVVTGAQITTLNGTITSSTTPIVVNSTVGFPASGTILIDNELITYTSKTSTDFAGTVTRGAFGTIATSHSNGVVVTNASSFTGWGNSAPSGAETQIRLWSQSNFGQDLLFCPRGGSLYLWTPGIGPTPAVTTRAKLVGGVDIPGTEVPTKVNQIMVSDTSRIVIAFGCNDYTTVDPTETLDPLLIRWSAQESYTDWAISATTQAGYYRLSHGSKIIGALQTRQEILVWTDSAIYAMQYLGPPYVYGFTLLADNISIVSPNCMATASGVVYWMGVDKLYVYSGRAETLPCAVRTYIYDDINRSQYAQVFSGTNEGFSEVWWYYCSANSDAVDRYVVFNYLDRVWYYGSMPRTAWLDSALRDTPIAATYGSQLVYHEQGNDDGTFNPPIAIESYIQSSDFDIGDGHNYGFVWRMIPDITFDGSTTPSPLTPTVTMSMRPRQNPGAPYGASPTPSVSSAQTYSQQVQTYNVQEFTEIIFTRVRGRQMAFKVASNTIGTQWQLGVPRLDVRPDGRR